MIIMQDRLQFSRFKYEVQNEENTKYKMDAYGYCSNFVVSNVFNSFGKL